MEVWAGVTTCPGCLGLGDASQDLLVKLYCKHSKTKATPHPDSSLGCNILGPRGCLTWDIAVFLGQNFVSVNFCNGESQWQHPDCQSDSEPSFHLCALGSVVFPETSRSADHCSIQARAWCGQLDELSRS